MAIKNKVKLDNGVIVDEAYCRVENIQLSKTEMTFTLRNYVEVEKPFFSESLFSCSYDIEGDNAFIQAYEHVKSLDYFVSSIDC